MDKIEISVINKEAISTSEKMAVAMARLTQRGHVIKNMADFNELLDKDYGSSFVQQLCDLPHPTLQKFGVIHVAVVGASRRFLAQITRHQNEIKFMSGSLQYSDYSNDAQFVVPYEILDYESNHGSTNILRQMYIDSCRRSMGHYSDIAKSVGNDAAGYAAPQGLRNVLVMSATPYQWKHMIKQRICRRNTSETRYVMLKIWEQFFRFPMFEDCWPSCWHGTCEEGKMCCGKSLASCYSPAGILEEDFPLLMK